MINKETYTQSFKALFRNLVPFVKPYRGMIAGTLFLTLVGSFAAQVNPLLVNETINRVEDLLRQPDPFQNGMRLLLIISAIMLANELLNIGIQFGQKYFGEKIRIKVGSDLSQASVERILSYKMSFFSEPGNQTGLLQTRINRGIESLIGLVQNFFLDILPLFSTAIIALVVMYNANLYVGLLATIIMPAYFYVSQKQAGRLKGWRIQLRGQRERKNHGLINIIDSITVIKSFVREEPEGKKQYDVQMEMLNNQLQTRRTSYVYESLKSFIQQIGVVLIIILTVFLVLDGQMGIGAIMMHIMLFRNVSAPISQLHRIYDQVNDALIYADGFFEVLSNDEAVEAGGDIRAGNVQGQFEVRDVTFTYPNEKQALSNVTLSLEKGKTTAIVGLSGAGKSTLINLLCKFYKPDSGKILLDGVDLEDYENGSLRNNIGLVLQKNHIFKGTIYDNILYGKLDATGEEVIEASKRAFLHDQVLLLPEGYDTDAFNLSGGQQQRIAIARLFLKNPPVIFLDEPTASLDAIAAEHIKMSLDAIKEGRTVVIISHSLSQIIDADVIHVLKDGRLVETGSHESLYKLNGEYRKIFDASARSLNLNKMLDTLAV
ncbi:ABC-type multidrug transport system, ATPase and permease component [Porphyromonadaceae bacterium NLAE-zl-C104]|uniref:ABC transporter ATP-binding protein n=1 Tax=Proteiniphilum saccharofermentans TaxID=1642647 RepID=UPI000898BF91|nr:ABC transporter ATP-binding protein [Proteiniphilum saccharofermentans]SEA27714.1 ABC-type multidrug transport system, ATPase and permease component [Porphyromonadaceae bacterium KH3R12]SFT04392.1 ABC-type multidrug transport system, ATPase and permease component [Porphyromonadaceae bacterium NLAE-zl-C104]